MRKTRHLGTAALYFAAFVNVSTVVAQVAPASGKAASQAPPAPPAGVRQAPVAGLENPWDVRKIIADLQKDTSNLEPLLRQINPQEWYDKKGAPSTYIVQWQSAQQQLSGVLSAAQLFAQKTEGLSLALDTYFRVESLEVAERALLEGVRKYDTPANAGKLDALISHNFTSRERIRGYLRDLASTTEQNFKIADGEAQRCREMISRQSVLNQTRKSK